MEVNASFIQKRKYEFDLNDEEEEEEIDIGSFSSLSHDEEEDGGGGGDEEVSSYSFGSSSSSELLEDATSSSLDSSSSSSSNGPLFEMSSLISQLPVKRGLSKHFEGKSQSFTSLSNVKSLEDLIKPERRLPFKKKLKSSKSYAWSLDTSSSLSQKNSSKPITKIKNPNYSKGSLSSLDNMKKHSFSKTSLGTINWVDN